MKCLDFKELGLTAKEMTGSEAVGNRVASYEADQRVRTAEVVRRVKSFQRQPAVLKTTSR